MPQGTRTAAGQVDFGPYIENVKKRIAQNWQVPKISTAAQTTVFFSIKPGGDIAGLTVKKSSGNPSVDDQALAAVRRSAPFEKLPRAFKGPYINVEYVFDIRQPAVPAQTPSTTSDPPAAPIPAQKPATASEPEQANPAAYIEKVKRRIAENWKLPPAAGIKPVVVSLSIKRDGKIADLTIKESSGNVAVDESALASIREAAPFEKLPDAYPGKSIEIEHTFDVGGGVTEFKQLRALLTRSSFPLKVWINPYYRSTEELAPPDVLDALHQGVLDWIRLLVTAPSADSKAYTFILNRLARETLEETLLAAEFLDFVNRPEKADLKIEVTPRTRISGQTLGIFINAEGRVGRIEIATSGSSFDDTREFYLRTILLHEIGHALGLDHWQGDECNFMSANYATCVSEVSLRCSSRETRCVNIHTDQMRAIEKLLVAESAPAQRADLQAEVTAQSADSSGATRPVAQVPAIERFEYSPSDRPLKDGEVLQLRLVGTPGARVTYEVINYTYKNLMREVQPGQYEAQIRFSSGVSFKDATVEAVLANAQGRLVRTADRKLTAAAQP